MEREKAIDRAAKLKAQMESEHAIGNSAAAEAFAAMMQRMMLEHELSEQELQAARSTKVVEEPVKEFMVNLAKCGIQQKAARSANLERLAGIVGRAHLCRILVKPRTNTIWFVGTAKHAEVAEYMLSVLHRNLQKIAKDAYEVVYAEDSGKSYRTKGYIGSFKSGFLERLATRYEDERKRVIADVDQESGSCTALVRLNNQLQRVDAYISERYRSKSVGSANGRTVRNSIGHRHGQAAADRIGLRANAVKSGVAPKQIGGA